MKFLLKICPILPILVISHAAFSVDTEYRIKAVFLEKFTLFVEWPAESAMEDTSQPFIIGVIGANPFGDILEKVYSGSRINGKRVELRYLSGVSEIEKCHLLFIGKTPEKNLSRIISVAQNKPILTVSDSEGMAKRGIHINFYRSGEKVKFEINPSAVSLSGLKMSYKLLQMARIVTPEGGKS